MRPRPTQAAAFKDRSRAGYHQPQKPLFIEHPNSKPSPDDRDTEDASCSTASPPPSDSGENRYTHMSMKLYVGNLSFQTSSEDLQQLFGQAGTVESSSVIEDRETGRSRGFGFVEMATKEEGQKAIEQFNGKEVNGRNLNVNEAKAREDRSGGRSRGGFGGSRSSGGYGGDSHSRY